jgi:hypothetical protein
MMFVKHKGGTTDDPSFPDGKGLKKDMAKKSAVKFMLCLDIIV